MALTETANCNLNGHLRLDSLQIVQFVALVRGTGYRLAMFKPEVNGV